MDPVIKIVSFVTIPLIQLIIWMVITCLGCRFLLIQASGAALVMKVVAMQIVLGIDEMIVSSIALHKVCQRLGKTRILLMKLNHGTLDRMYWFDGVGSVVFALFNVGIVLFFVDFLYGDLTHFRRACLAYGDMFSQATIE